MGRAFGTRWWPCTSRRPGADLTYSSRRIDRIRPDLTGALVGLSLVEVRKRGPCISRSLWAVEYLGNLASGRLTTSPSPNTPLCGKWPWPWPARSWPWASEGHFLESPLPTPRRPRFPGRSSEIGRLRCPPCQYFVPILAQSYQQIRDTHGWEPRNGGGGGFGFKASRFWGCCG